MFTWYLVGMLTGFICAFLLVWMHKVLAPKKEIETIIFNNPSEFSEEEIKTLIDLLKKEPGKWTEYLK